MPKTLLMRKKQVPTGAVQPFAGSTAPDGYLICDGSAISRTLYPKLFDVIGTTHGIGDGVDTFNLPDYRYLTPRGRGGVADQVVLPAAVNITTKEITVTGHQYRRTGFRVRVSSTGTIISGLAINTNYYVIVVDANTIKLATTRANAIAGTAINLTSQGTGTHTISQAEGPDFLSRTAVNGGNAGDNVGSLEEDSIQNHRLTVDTYQGSSGSNVANTGTSSGGPFTIPNNGSLSSLPPNGTLRASRETRQSNILTNYIIKV
jgi:microcystin-dependent protein